MLFRHSCFQVRGRQHIFDRKDSGPFDSNIVRRARGPIPMVVFVNFAGYRATSNYASAVCPLTKQEDPVLRIDPALSPTGGPTVRHALAHRGPFYGVVIISAPIPLIWIPRHDQCSTTIKNFHRGLVQIERIDHRLRLRWNLSEIAARSALAGLVVKCRLLCILFVETARADHIGYPPVISCSPTNNLLLAWVLALGSGMLLDTHKI